MKILSPKTFPAEISVCLTNILRLKRRMKAFVQQANALNPLHQPAIAVKASRLHTPSILRTTRTISMQAQRIPRNSSPRTHHLRPRDRRHSQGRDPHQHHLLQRTRYRQSYRRQQRSEDLDVASDRLFAASFTDAIRPRKTQMIRRQTRMSIQKSQK